ncbi:amino acid permease [Streptomyces sp. WAC06614]|uniref:amino acid permease n=1 Tax=Streptomyces sp. WAC06614 TaxID=2487416 RepID=UPI000F7BA70C|nr:amino acid permease [Streptomyces sp. WAC06614]RSS78656.1 amino acid permease [Streptomyces sp. WAC06614]
MADIQAPAATEAASRPVHGDAGDEGYSKQLKPRHMTMIAIGGAIGTGLFLGAGGRLAEVGPALAIAYALCGIFAVLVVRALGELVVHRPSSGAFVSYAREFMGEKGAYTAGWLYFLNWAVTGIADITAAATYAHFWSMFTDVPQWVLALVALAVVLAANLVSVKYFGEMEFWFSLVKVAALVVFMGVAVFLIATRHPVDGHVPGLASITGHGGLFPSGVLPMMLVMQGIVFAYAGLELSGIAAGETEDARKVVPKALNSIIWRIALFYVGSVVLLSLLLPHTAYSAGESPFVTVLAKLGIPGAAGVMNLVVLTAALSSLNSGLYSTGRILRSMAMAGSAPRFTARMNKGQVPYGGILLTASFGVVGVVMNFFIPHDSFEVVLNFASFCILATWAMIMICSLLFWRRSRRGLVDRPAYRLPWAPYSQIVTLLFLLAVLVLVCADGGVGSMTALAMPVVVAALVGGWFLVRRRVATLAASTAPAAPAHGGEVGGEARP